MSTHPVAEVLQFWCIQPAALHDQDLVHAISLTEGKTGVQSKRGTVGYSRCHRRREVPSIPCISKVSSSGRRHWLWPCPQGAANLPDSSRLVHSTKPEPSQKSTLSLLRALLIKTNKKPEVGSCCRVSLIRTERPLKLFRPSIGLVARKTRVAGDRLSMAAGEL